ncbi:unnamed protein product [Hermetia illucens]|uniref:Uncharacterized protein n=1 Tax=Hermetia illucens TaxID=343691 RepID=A0A7R8UM22_HERIL|nr:unnamed protein product [Hermetia illucens]
MASSSNYLISVPKLKGRENYSEWCFAAENVLVLEGKVGCIKPEHNVTPAASDDAETKAKLILTRLFMHI